MFRLLRKVSSISCLRTASALLVASLQENDYSWKLATNNADAVRKQLMELTLRNNLNIVSLQTEGNNLEEIFRSLTQADKQ